MRHSRRVMPNCPRTGGSPAHRRSQQARNAVQEQVVHRLGLHQTRRRHQGMSRGWLIRSIHCRWTTFIATTGATTPFQEIFMKRRTTLMLGAILTAIAGARPADRAGAADRGAAAHRRRLRARRLQRPGGPHRGRKAAGQARHPCHRGEQDRRRRTPRCAAGQGHAGRPERADAGQPRSHGGGAAGVQGQRLRRRNATSRRSRRSTTTNSAWPWPPPCRCASSPTCWPGCAAIQKRPTSACRPPAACRISSR